MTSKLLDLFSVHVRPSGWGQKATVGHDNFAEKKTTEESLLTRRGKKAEMASLDFQSLSREEEKVEQVWGPISVHILAGRDSNGGISRYCSPGLVVKGGHS